MKMELPSLGWKTRHSNLCTVLESVASMLLATRFNFYKGFRMKINKHGVGDNIVLDLVAGATFVLPSILMEDDGFVKLFKNNEPIQKLIDYVNENF